MKKYYIKTQYKPGYKATVLSEVTEYEIKELLKNNPELLNNSVGKPTHKRKYFVPKDNEEYRIIDTDGEILQDWYDRYNITDVFRKEAGNCFATEQDAQDEINRRQAMVRLWNNYDDKYSWDIDWEDTSIKYEIAYEHDKKWFCNYSRCNNQVSTELPYFKSAEDRNQFVSENESDLKLIFNIK